MTTTATADARGGSGHAGASGSGSGDSTTDADAPAQVGAAPAPLSATDPTGASTAASVIATPATAPTDAASQMAAAPQTSLSPTIASLSAQIAQQAGQKTSQFDVQLTPGDLGRVDVAVQIDAAGNVTASLSFEKADSAALVKDQSGQLQSALESSGLSLDSLKITHVQADGGQAAPTLTAAAQQTVAAGGSASGAGFQSGGQGNGQGAGQPGQHTFTGGDQASLGSGGQAGSQSGGQPGGQAGGQPGGQQNGASGSALALRNFQAAASAADGADLQAAYASNLSSRGLDIRI